MHTSRHFSFETVAAALVLGIVAALGGASCGAAVGANSPASRKGGLDRCATMSCPTGSHCVSDSAGGGGCQPDPMPNGGLPHFP